MNTQAVTERLEARIDTEAAKGMALRQLGGGAAIVPQNVAEAMELAKMMAVARIGIRKHLRNNPGACFMVAQQAMRWEMDPFAVANKSYEVNDQIAYEAQLITAVLNTRAPIKGRIKYEYEGEGNHRRCRAYAVLIEDGERVEVRSPPYSSISPKNSPLWKTDPDQQLAYYTGRLLARRYFSEVLLGVYDPDEMPATPLAQTPDGTYQPVEAPPRPTRASTRRMMAEEEKQAAQVVETVLFTTADDEQAHYDLPGEADALRAAWDQERGAAEERGTLDEFLDANPHAAQALDIEIAEPSPAHDRDGVVLEPEPAEPQTEYLNDGVFYDLMKELDAKADEGGKALDVFLASHGVQQKFGQMNDDQKDEWNRAVKEALGTK